MENFVKNISCLFIVLLLVNRPIFAQPTFSNIEHFTIENGLSQSVVNCILQDSQGFMWIGTQDGLNKYDGYHFSIYRHDPLDPYSISSNYVNSICEDRKHNIWVATQYGLNKFDRKKSTFTSYFNNPNDGGSLSDNEIFSIFCDSKGNVWLKTLNTLEKFDENTKKFTHYKYKLDYFNLRSGYNLFCIAEDHKGNIWVGTKEGLGLLDIHSETIKLYRHDPSNPSSISNDQVRAIYEDSLKNIWVGTDYGLNKLNIKTGKFESYMQNGIPTINSINKIFEDSFHNLWLCTEHGIFVFDRNKKNFSTNFIVQKAANTKSQIITSMFEDYSKILWIGTWDGLYKLDSKKQKFAVYRKGADNTPDFTNNNLRSILVDDNNVIWFGTRDAGLNIFDRKTNKVIQYTAENKQNNIPNNSVQSLFKDSKNRILVGTANGVFEFNSQTKKFTAFCPPHSACELIFKNNRINRILEDSKGDLWFATNHGLHEFYENRLIQSFVVDMADTAGLCSNHVNTLIEDIDGTFWIGTIEGLNNYNPKTRKMISFKRSNTFLTTVSNNNILSLLIDSKCVLWIGTESGLNKYNRKTNSFKFFTQQNGFANDFIYGILTDNSDNLWVSTNRGISKFNPIKEEVTNYDLVDGLQNYEFNIGAYYKTKNGEMFFGGIDGFNAFFPDSILINKFIPKVIITSIEYQRGDKKLKVNVGSTKDFSFHFKDYMFEIEFAALEFTHPERNSYKYQMEGLNSEWISTGSTNKAQFNNLPSGDYVFKVIGANSDKQWSEDVTSINIHIDYPFYNNNYAYIAYIVFGGLLMYLFTLILTKNLRKANQVLIEKQKTAQKISKQKEELSLKNKNITDSLNYAQRIIKAMMPSQKLLQKLLPNSFILFRPKEIVSGDFYWIGEKNHKIFVAAVDCTGHGIPGAFMSIIGFDLLRNITKVQGIEDPAEILNLLNLGVADTFGEDEDNAVKDGMDIAFCVIDKSTQTLEFAGAFNPLYLIRDNRILEIKADRFSVGKASSIEEQRFTSHVIPLQPKDVIYIFSDGYVDQFGGTEAKKFKFRRFRHVLLNIHKLPVEEQKAMLNKSFDEWRGNLEQVDDVLIIGIIP